MYYNDYETEPIGGGNPYHRCVHCKRSVPEINGRLDRHLADCEYRIAIESGAKYPRDTTADDSFEDESD